MSRPTILINSITIDSSSELASGTLELLQAFRVECITAPPELHAALDEIWARITGQESETTGSAAP